MKWMALLAVLAVFLALPAMAQTQPHNNDGNPTGSTGACPAQFTYSQCATLGFFPGMNTDPPGGAVGGPRSWCGNMKAGNSISLHLSCGPCNIRWCDPCTPPPGTVGTDCIEDTYACCGGNQGQSAQTFGCSTGLP